MARRHGISFALTVGSMRPLSLVLLALMAACAAAPSENADSGSAADAGARDGGSTADAGSSVDGGSSADSGNADAGGNTDAGATGDGGAGVLSVVQSFEGDFGLPGALCDGGCLYRNHPDMSVAANGTQVVEGTGQNISVFDYSGRMLKQTALPTFITGAGLTAGQLNDPRLTYDVFTSRWIVACSCSADFLMVSNTSDATGSWTGYTLGVSTGDLTMWPGWDKNGVYVSEFQNGSAPPYPYAVVALDPTLTHKTVFTNFPYESRPATDPNPNKLPTDPEYFVARDGPTQNGTNVAFNVLVDSVSWSGTTAAKGTEQIIPSGFLYNTPLDAAQTSGPPVKSLESHRAFASAVQNGHLHTVIASGPCTSSCGAQGADPNQLFFWFDVDLTRMALAQSAKVSSPTDAYLFPSLAVDLSGNVGMVATAVSSTRDASVVLFGHATTDPSGFVSQPLVAEAGTQSFTCDNANPVGWGTYTHGYQDPADPTKLWTVEEYAGSAPDCQWHTRIVEFTP